MPRTVDLFLDSDQPLEQLADRIGELVGQQLVASPDRQRFVLQRAGVVAHLSAHDFVDDDGLPLSEFRYVLSACVPFGADLDRSAELGCLRAVSARLRADGELACLLVIDLERPDGERP